MLDIAAVNLAYFLALIMRFYVNNEFRSSVSFYLTYFARYAPVYTVLCLIVFALCRLYGGMWRYAGINDMNRIILANLCTMVLHVAVSILCIRLMPEAARSRMPISYYLIGAVLQFVFIVLIRFSYRMLLVEKTKLSSRRLETIPAIVIGSGDLGRRVVRHLEDNTPFRAVTIVGSEEGRSMDGVPIIPLSALSQQIRDKNIKAVFIADKELTKEARETIQQAAEGLEMEDFTGYMSNLSGFLPLTGLLEVMEAPFTIEINGELKQFSSAEECLTSLTDEYDVVSIQAARVVLKKKQLDDSWMKVYQEQTGQEVSYF